MSPPCAGSARFRDIEGTHISEDPRTYLGGSRPRSPPGGSQVILQRIRPGGSQDILQRIRPGGSQDILQRIPGSAGSLSMVPGTHKRAVPGLPRLTNRSWGLLVGLGHTLRHGAGGLRRVCPRPTTRASSLSSPCGQSPPSPHRSVASAPLGGSWCRPKAGEKRERKDYI